MWLRAVARLSSGGSPVIRTGAGCRGLSGSTPSWHPAFAPQQYVAPSTSSPHPRCHVNDTIRQRIDSETGAAGASAPSNCSPLPPPSAIGVPGARNRPGLTMARRYGRQPRGRLGNQRRGLRHRGGIRVVPAVLIIPIGRLRRLTWVATWLSFPTF